MPEYHVGCGMFGIYAGTLNPRNKERWQNKSEVTHEAIDAVAEYLLNEHTELRFDCKGKHYALRVVEITEDEKGGEN